VTPKTENTVVLAALAVLGIPLSYLLTILLFPFWTYLEATTGIESAGQSGPAAWCFVLVFALMLAACLIGAIRALGRESRGD